MRKYAVIAISEGKPWLGLTVWDDPYGQRHYRMKDFWEMSWLKGKFTAVEYSKEFIDNMPGVDKDLWKLAIHLPRYNVMKHYVEISTSEKAMNCYIHGKSVNQFIYRLAKHILATKRHLLPKGYEARIYRVGSKEFKHLIEDSEKATALPLNCPCDVCGTTHA